MKNPFKRYLDKEDLRELQKRQEQINEHTLVVQLLQGAIQQWIQLKLSKYGLDAQKQYEVNPLTGKITLIKPKKDAKELRQG